MEMKKKCRKLEMTNRVLHLFFELLFITYGMLDAKDKGLNKTEEP